MRAGKRSRTGVALVAAFAVFVVMAIWLRGSGITSRRHAWPLEARLAAAVRSYLVPDTVKRTVNPVPDSPEVIRAGMEHFADHCATCHANDGSGDIALGRAMFPPAPDMRAGATQARSDGELFYAIEHGIPFTGMAAWGNGTPEGTQSSWELVRFIRHLPQLTAGEISEMEALNPRSAADEKRARDIRDFLSGKGQE